MLIVGAGPHGLTAACYLLAADPALAGRIAVADPRPWLAAWQAQFARLELTALRSACVHHPDPQPYAMLHWAQARGRSPELTGTVGTPTAGLFADFCRWLVLRHGLAAARVPASVTGLHPRDDGRIDVVLGARRLRAGSVVLATGGASVCEPAPAGDAGQIGRHSETVQPAEVRAGQVVVVVGAGLTAGHLALRAAARGARVHLVVRAPLRARTMDVEAGWLGADLLRFAALPASARAQEVRRARPGTVPAGVRHALLSDPRIDVHLGAVTDATACGRVRLDDGREVAADHLWWATGYSYAVDGDPLTAALAAEVPVATVAGLPLLGTDLAWGATRVHLSGGLAALQIGPAARGLAGARMAAERYAEAITGVEPPRRQYPTPSSSPDHRRLR